MKIDPLHDPDSRLRALAGFLAERSVQSVILSHRGTRREFAARATDLPRELQTLARDGGEIEVPRLGAVIHFAGADIRCTSDDPAVSIAILKALAPR